MQQGAVLFKHPYAVKTPPPQRAALTAEPVTVHEQQHVHHQKTVPRCHDTPANSCTCACLFSPIQVENARRGRDEPIGHWHLWYFESTLLTNQAQPEALADSASRWVLLVLRAKSNTQRNTYTSCKLHCIQWKSELWCYGNTRKPQLLLQKMNLKKKGDRCGGKIYVRISSKKIVFKDKISTELQTIRKLNSYMSRLPGADMDLSSRRLGHSKGLLKERFLSMAFTKIWNRQTRDEHELHERGRRTVTDMQGDALFSTCGADKWLQCSSNIVTNVVATYQVTFILQQA